MVKKLIMRNILTKIHIHPITYMVILISFFTGLFKELFMFMEIIIIHELGHILGAIYFNWKIEKILILPFGGITIFNDLINKPLKEEFIILILGPLFQLINFIIFKDINPNFNYYNYGLFIFNLLPIYPLDGYKFWNIFFNLIFPFKFTMKLTLLISIIFLFLFLKFNLIYILIILFLLIGIIKEYKKIDYIYNKFILERLIYNFNFKKIKTINNIDNMYKDTYHYIKEDKLINEEELIKKRYNLTK